MRKGELEEIEGDVVQPEHRDEKKDCDRCHCQGERVCGMKRCGETVSDCVAFRFGDFEQISCGFQRCFEAVCERKERQLRRCLV